MKTAIFFLFVAACVNLSAESEISFGIASGKDSYRNYSAELKYSTETYYISGGFNSYESDYLYKRNTYSLSFGFYGESTELGFSLSDTPQTDGYKNYSAGAELYYLLLDSESFFLKPGIFLSSTWHSDLYSSTSTTLSFGRNKSSYSVRTTPFELRETEYGVSMKTGFKFISGDFYYSRTSYDKEISITDRSLQTLISENSYVAESGFPKYSWGAELYLNIGNGFSTGMGYSYCAYLLDEPSSKTYRFSLSKTFGDFTPELSYEYNESALGSNYLFGLFGALKI